MPGKNWGQTAGQTAFQARISSGFVLRELSSLSVPQWARKRWRGTVCVQTFLWALYQLGRSVLVAKIFFSGEFVRLFWFSAHFTIFGK